MLTKLNKEYLLDLFRYDKKRGILIWKNHWHLAAITRLRNKEAGSYNKGYRRVKIKNQLYSIHRLIYFLETSRWLKENIQIDHLNGNKSDNTFKNLRPVNNRENQQNRKSHRKGKLVGTCWDKSRQRWAAQININYKHYNLGRFDTEIEAHQRYLEALEEFNV